MTSIAKKLFGMGIGTLVALSLGSAGCYAPGASDDPIEGSDAPEASDPGSEGDPSGDRIGLPGGDRIGLPGGDRIGLPGGNARPGTEPPQELVRSVDEISPEACKAGGESDPASQKSSGTSDVVLGTRCEWCESSWSCLFQGGAHYVGKYELNNGVVVCHGWYSGCCG